MEINDFLIRDKFANPDLVAEVLKSEAETLLKNFFLFENEPVVRFRREGDNFVFNIEVCASRIKPFGSRLR